MATLPDGYLKALDDQGGQYDDSALLKAIQGVQYNSNEKGSWERGAVNTVDSHLDQLSPGELLNRYKSFANAGDIDSALKQKYGVATAKDKAYASAYKSAQNLLGRDLTSNEFAQLAPAFYNPADFGSGITTGRAALAQLAERDKNNPANLATKAPQHTDAVNGLFQDLLKRGASQDEITHFGSMLASGSVDPYELRSFIQATPEYQTNEDTKFRTGLADELQGYDTKFFNQAKNDVLSQYSNQGIQPGTSSSLDFALTDLMGKVADKRSQYLSGLSANQYGGNKDAARQDYLAGMGQFVNQKGYNQSRNDQGIDALTQRGYNAMDYNTQKNDYLSFLSGQKQATDPYAKVGRAAIGGIGGFAAGGPVGAVIGTGLGYLNS